LFAFRACDADVELNAYEALVALRAYDALVEFKAYEEDVAIKAYDAVVANVAVLAFPCNDALMNDLLTHFVVAKSYTNG
jgi:hypothetical protein